MQKTTLRKCKNGLKRVDNEGVNEKFENADKSQRL